MEIADDSTKSVLAFLQDKQFAHIWRSVNEKFPTWEEFSSMAIPGGSSHEAIWSLVSVLRRGLGRDVPYPNGPKIWYALPLEQQQEIWDIVSRSSASSILGRHLEKYGYLSTGVEGQVNELLAVMKNDGSILDYESVRAVVVCERRPQNICEMIIRNYCRILDDEACSPICKTSTVAELYESLTDNTQTSTNFRNKDIFALNEDMKTVQRTDSAMTLCCSAHFFEVPTHYRSAGKWSTVFGSLLRKVFFIRSKYPSLSLLPLSKEMLDWGGCEDDPFTSPLIPSHCEDTHNNSLEFTFYFIVYLRKIREGIDFLEQLVTVKEQRENGLRNKVRTTHLLNYRQRDVVLASLDNPTTVFSYEEHQITYQVAYATARADLLGLMERGFLQSRIKGKRNLLFCATLEFRKTIESQLV